MKKYLTTLVTILVALAFGVSACGPQPDDVAQEPVESQAEEVFGQRVITEPDTTGASLWAFLQQSNYRDAWPMWPNKSELYTGQEPHGMLLTTYVNQLALGAVNTKAGVMPDGAVIVKENYTPDSTLAAITVMRKLEGYNPDHNDWFFAKFLPTGELATGPEGMALEGRVPSCQACHGKQKDNDYIFTSAIR